MATKSEFLNELYKDNGLVKSEDTYELSFGKRSVNIITRTGIEKIQYHNNITVTLMWSLLTLSSWWLKLLLRRVMYLLNPMVKHRLRIHNRSILLLWLINVHYLG